MRLTALEESFAICKLAPDAALPEWAARGPFVSVTRTADELSIVTAEDAVPDGVENERGWRGLKVAGPLDLSLVGILASLAAPLAEAGIGLFAVSTFDTDYLLVKAERFEDAKRALEGAGHEVEVEERMSAISVLERSKALWNRNRLDLRSEETLAQILDRGSLDDWRAIYRLAAEDEALRARLCRVVGRVPLGYPYFWRVALRSLGEEVDLDAPVPEDPGVA